MITAKRKAAESKAKIRDILYPLIYEASQHIQDEYWRDFFVDLSKNKHNRKIHIDDKYVSHTGKKISFNYCYDGKQPEEIASELRRIISDTFCLYSETDMIHEKDAMTALASEFKESTKTEANWKKVKNKKFKDHLITNYVLRMKDLHKLSNQATRQAYSTVVSALFDYRTHKGADINMVDGEITSIDDITITAQKICNERLADFEDSQEKSGPKKVNWSKEWEKTCNAIVKQSMLYLCLDHDDMKKKKKKRLVPTVAQPVKEDETLPTEEVAQMIMNEIDELAELQTGFPEEDEDAECSDEACEDGIEDEEEDEDVEDDVEEDVVEEEDKS